MTVGRPAATQRRVNVFVARTGNRFMSDIADWLVEAVTLNGRSAALVDDRLPVDDGSINLVVAPHEFYLLRDDDDAAIRRAARSTRSPATGKSSLSMRKPATLSGKKLPSISRSPIPLPVRLAWRKEGC